MKLSLLTTILIGSLAVSAHAATLLVGYDDFSSTTSGGYSIAGSYTTSGGKLVLPQGGTAPATTDVVITGGAFSSQGTAGSATRTESIVTMTISGFTLPSSGTSVLFECGQENTGQWGVGVNSQGKLTGLWGNGVNATGTNGSIDWTKPVTLTASTNNNGTTFYINGDKVGATIGGLKGSGALYDRLYLGGNGFTTGTLQKGGFTVENLYVHGGTMTDAEIKAFVESIPSPSVPEPSTATLGVLGLVSLMLRRRRK